MPVFHPVMMRFLRILLALLFVWHLFACLYWYIARREVPCPRQPGGSWSRGDSHYDATYACWTPPFRAVSPSTPAGDANPPAARRGSSSRPSTPARV